MAYQFGRSAFTDFLWLKNGGLFSNVTLVEVETLQKGAFRLEVVNPSGQVISSSTRDASGWNTFDFMAGMNPPVIPGMSPYKLRFVNASPGEKKLLQGQVTP